MPEDTKLVTKTLKEYLHIDDNELDEDPGIALTSLITTAVHDVEPKHDLASIVEAVKATESASELEPLTVLPTVVGSAQDGADELIDLMAAECSAKEVVMAVEEAVEILDRRLQSGDGEEHEEDEAAKASPSKQIVRFIRAYTSAIPRLPKWRKSPKEAVESKLTELRSIIAAAADDATAVEGRSIIREVSSLVLALSAGADVETKELLRGLMETVLTTFPNHLQGGLARKAFEAHFRRLVIPRSESLGADAQEGVMDTAWNALRSLGISTSSYGNRASLASLILLAHDGSYVFSPSDLNALFPFLLSSLQSNVALDEDLAILIRCLAPLHLAKPRQELEVDFVIPLIHLLPPLASHHPDPDIRHYTFRALSMVLGLSPSPVRFQLLKDLLSDEGTPPQMRIAAVGLLKEAVLEGLSQATQNLFASPHLLSTFGPIVLRPDPPDVLETIASEDFLEGPEPLRLVECLGFYYVLLQRDSANRTGVRDGASLDNVHRVLLDPLRVAMNRWTGEPASSTRADSEEHGGALQLGILEMWLDRVSSAMAALEARAS
ncbi:hypothetical protein C8Q77DRAFT_1217164 [Trametes polyzona]|nr:hypothetical protein C8Q77DRAFT_1217164 [Trametes polyzona]